MGVEHRLGEVSESGRIADGHIDVPTVGVVEKATVGPGRSGIPGWCESR